MKGKHYPKYGQMVKGYKYAGPITFNQYGYIQSGSFPNECIADCSASGSADDAVEYWRDKLNFVTALEPVRDRVESYLEEFGAWDDLATADMEILADRVLWTACCGIKEYGDWFGVCN